MDDAAHKKFLTLPEDFFVEIELIRLRELTRGTHRINICYSDAKYPGAARVLLRPGILYKITMALLYTPDILRTPFVDRDMCGDVYAAWHLNDNFVWAPWVGDRSWHQFYIRTTGNENENEVS